MPSFSSLRKKINQTPPLLFKKEGKVDSAEHNWSANRL